MRLHGFVTSKGSRLISRYALKSNNNSNNSNNSTSIKNHKNSTTISIVIMVIKTESKSWYPGLKASLGVAALQVEKLQLDIKVGLGHLGLPAN